MKTFPLMCRVRAEANATRIDVYDEIGEGGPFGGGYSAKDFATQLAGVKGPLDVHINSYGGSVKDGIGIASAIRGHKGPKRTIVDGMACSAASVIMQAGDERIVQPGSMVMIHDASAGVMGNPAEVRKVADELDKFSDNIAQVYADRAGGTPEQWRAAMRDETWYTADEAVSAGLADKVGTGTAVAPGELDLSAFAAVPERVMARLQEMPLRQPKAAYHPQPYKREDRENTKCPVCGKYGDQDATYCGQCGVQLAGRDDIEQQPPDSDDDPTDRAPLQPTAAATDWLRQKAAADKAKAEAEAAAQAVIDAGYTAAQLAAAIEAAATAIDQSDWDGPKAMSMAAKSDDPAAAYKQICAGTKAGDPSKRDSWALPYRYPGKGPNAAGVRNALSRLPQTDDLTNKADAQALLERLMKQVNPDYDGDDATNSAPAWITQTQPAIPAWLIPA
jgi:ATP-dependent protease ClpP protease subunit